jgi:calcium/calmodulin-dependent protein kinase I
VYVAKRKLDSKLFAAKAFYKKLLFANDAKGRSLIENEIAIMRKLKHPNLINLHEIFENKAQTYLIIDLARGGNLETALKTLNGPVPFLAAKVIFR